MKFFTLCADDYGLNPSINSGINSLIRAGRLNAVSCMTVGKDLNAPPLLEAISESPTNVQVGLHLALTEYAPLGAMPEFETHGRFPSVGKLLAKSHLRSIDRIEVAEELSRQFDAFEQIFGRPPDFVDGHQHIHIFPGIRDEAIMLATPRMTDRDAGLGWMRCCATPGIDLLNMKNTRAVLLAAMGRRQHSKLRHAGLECNERFYGVNNFDSSQSFRDLMQGWLRMVASKSTPALIMCHPGEPSSDPNDPIAIRRPDELAYLNSDDFADDLETHNLTL